MGSKKKADKVGFPDDRQFKKSTDALFKQVTDKLMVLDDTTIGIILDVACCLDEKKILLWLKTRNPAFGMIAPIKLINLGRAHKVRQFTLEAAIEGQFKDIDHTGKKRKFVRDASVKFPSDVSDVLVQASAGEPKKQRRGSPKKKGG